MGLGSKQVSNDDEVHWSQTLLDSTTKDLSKSIPTKTNQQQHPQPEALDCPRCGSRNTKFCYYNNYNKSQPRHFCKACKRHWTKGGTLRNVPLGGGRKNKRHKPPNISAKTTPFAANDAAVISNMPSSTASRNSNNQDSHSLRLAAQEEVEALADQQKKTSELLIEAFNDISHNDDEICNFSISGLSPSQLDKNPSSVSGIEEAIISGQLDSLESSTITSVSMNRRNDFFSQPWQGLSASNGVAEMPNCWIWNDLDTLVSADLDIPWDDPEMNL